MGRKRAHVSEDFEGCWYWSKAGANFARTNRPPKGNAVVRLQGRCAPERRKVNPLTKNIRALFERRLARMVQLEPEEFVRLTSAAPLGELINALYVRPW